MPSLLMLAEPLIAPESFRLLPPLATMRRLEPSKVTGPVRANSREPPHWKSPLTTTGLATVRMSVVWPP